MPDDQTTAVLNEKPEPVTRAFSREVVPAPVNLIRVGRVRHDLAVDEGRIHEAGVGTLRVGVANSIS
jgi:hypothetical protein